MKTFVSHLWAFACQQALACFFPVMVFAMLGISHLFAGIIPRYDFMLLACVGIQILMYQLKMETKDEILVICIFHLLGLVMELFKVYIGSWSYPEFAYAKIGGVPLYSGFMYASVASYMCQSWRRLDLGITGWPHGRLAKVLGACIYINFFTNHFVTDVRWVIACTVMVLFFRVWVVFTVKGTQYRMPIVVAFLLIGFFIWLAENIATGLGAWKYAYQHHGWRVVSLQKLSSWDLLVIVSFIIVAELKMLKEKVGVPMVSTPQSVGQFAITRYGMALRARRRALTIRRVATLFVCPQTPRDDKFGKSPRLTSP